jgi:hypothetical protein
MLLTGFLACGGVHSYAPEGMYVETRLREREKIYNLDPYCRN